MRDRMTVQEAKEMMAQLRRVFIIVRLLEPEGFKLVELDAGEKDMSPTCQCYDFWKRGKRCENCISAQVSEEKPQRTKLEIMDSKIYQVIAKHVEIDGKTYVMEMINCLDNDTLVDENGRKALIKEITGYDKEIYTDALTGAYNRNYYEEQVKDTNTPSGVAMLDMDDFKLYNDLYGHQAGDIALSTVAKIILKSIRRTDMLIRYGGDELILIMPDISEEIFAKKLRHIQSGVKEAKIPGYSQMRLSVSIGGVLSRGESIDVAIHRADKLMYQAKTQKDAVVTEEEELQAVENEQKKDALSKKRYRILIIDDSEMNRAILCEMLGNESEILEAESGEKGLEVLYQYGSGISLVLLDIVMPGMSGFEVLTIMQQNHWTEDIPVMMISSEEGTAFVRQAYELGAVDSINRPFDAQVVHRRVHNTIKLYEKQRRLTAIVADQVYEKEKNNQMMISILSQIVEFRNGESGLHVQHINIMTGLLLERLTQKTDKYSLTWSDRQFITTASSLHDIGKIGIDDKILNKPGKLTKEEYEIIKTHTLIGAAMLDDMKIYRNEPLVKVAYQICRWHHERYDGKGYPDGLKGEEIPISAQVVSIADAYDALISERVYKKAFSHEKALEMIQNGECGAFNPLLLECLKEVQEKIREELQVTGAQEKGLEFKEKVLNEIQKIEDPVNISEIEKVQKK